MPEFHIIFRGVIALVPDRRFANGPTNIDVFVPDLRCPRLMAESGGAQHSQKMEIVDSHHAWLEYIVSRKLTSINLDGQDLSEPRIVEEPHNENRHPDGLATITTRWPEDGKTCNVFELSRKLISFKLDGQYPSGQEVEIVSPLLNHLATYEGHLKENFVMKNSLDESVAAAVKLVGGKLSLAEKSQFEYYVPLHSDSGEKTTRTTVATAVRWTTVFSREVELRLRFSNDVKELRFQPKGDLEVGITNRELDYLLSERLQPKGGEDDPEFLIYGDMIQQGRRRTLRHVPGLTPGGTKACGTGGIQPPLSGQSGGGS